MTREPAGTRRRRFRRLSREDGVAMVEFALVLPVLLAILTGILQFGLCFNKYLALTDAARAGAREIALSRGSPDANPCTTAETDVTNHELTTVPNPIYPGGFPSFSPTTDTCTNPGSWSQGDTVTFKIQTDYTFNVYGINLGTVRLSAQATDAIE